MGRCLILITFLLSSQSCSLTPEVPDKRSLSPFGVFNIVNFKAENFKLTINEDLTYQLCNNSECFTGEVSTVPANHGVILKDFYSSKQGRALESLSFGRPLSKEFLLIVRKLRSSQPNPDDFAFNLTYCNAIPCVSLGHSRRGVLFIKEH